MLGEARKARLGAAVAPPPLAENISKMHQGKYGCAHS